MDTFIQQMINGLVLGSVYALIALGYTMVYGVINLINFAHGEVLMVGAMTAWTVVTALSGTGWPGWLLMLIALLAAMLVCAILNFAVEKLAYRPLRNAPRLAPLITAMGVSLLLQTLAMIVWKPSPKPFPILLDAQLYHIGGAVINTVQILILVLTVVTLAASAANGGMHDWAIFKPQRKRRVGLVHVGDGTERISPTALGTHHQSLPSRMRGR